MEVHGLAPSFPVAMRNNPENQPKDAGNSRSQQIIARQSVFNLHHPVVPLAYFAAAIGVGMCAFHPLYLTMSLLTACCLNAFYRGIHATLRTIAWQIPLICLIALLNPLISTSGSTELFFIGTRVVYWESFAYGLCMGMLLSLTMLWFSNASHVLTSDKVMALTGNALPTTTLMVSMSIRLVPQFVRRGVLIDDARSACLGGVDAGRCEGESAAAPCSVRARLVKAREELGRRARQVSVLMGWSMEDSLETADAMRARGWGAASKRTIYVRQRFCARDAVALACFAVLAAAAVAVAAVTCSKWVFYPEMPAIALNWGVVAYAAMLAFPLILRLIEDTRWVR